MSKYTKISFEAPKPLRDELEEMAKVNERSLSGEIRSLIAVALDRRNAARANGRTVAQKKGD
jgi:hypothetical protein